MSRIYYPSARVNVALITPGGAEREPLRIGAVKPRSVSVTHNDPLTADEFDLELDEFLFPIDVRLVRTAAVDIHLGDTGAIDAELDVLSNTTRALVGQADLVSKDYKDGDAAVANLSGRDYSSFLLDETWKTRSVELDRPLDEIIAEVLATVAGVGALEVVNKFAPSPAPVIEASTPKERRFVADANSTVWEALAGLAMRVGALVTIVGDEIWIRPARSITTADKMPVFVEGRNLSSLHVERELGLEDVPNVEVKALDRKTMKLVRATWPDPPNKTTKVSRSKSQLKREENIEIKSFTVNVASPTEAKLREVAKNIFEFYSEQQISIEFSTVDLSVWELTSRDVAAGKLDTAEKGFPVTSIRNGTPIRVYVDRGARNFLRKAVSSSQKRRELEAMGYRAQVADELARHWRALDTALFTNTATHSIAEGGAYSLDVKGQNFITV